MEYSYAPGPLGLYVTYFTVNFFSDLHKYNLYHITYGPGVPEHSAGNSINALVQYRFLFLRFALITLLQTGHKCVIYDDVTINNFTGSLVNLLMRSTTYRHTSKHVYIYTCKM